MPLVSRPVACEFRGPLASANVTNQLFEFRNSVPQRVRDNLDARVVIPTGKTLDIATITA